MSWGLVSQLTWLREGLRVTRAPHLLAWPSPVTKHSLPSFLFTCELGMSVEGPVLLLGLRWGVGFRNSKFLHPTNSRKPTSCVKRGLKLLIIIISTFWRGA